MLTNVNQQKQEALVVVESSSKNPDGPRGSLLWEESPVSDDREKQHEGFAPHERRAQIK
jgi:hypothetical protein